MPHTLETGTIRINKPDGSTAGTGFLVSKRLAVTCAHVVDSANAKAGDVIEFEYHLGNVDIQVAKVLENGWSPENDVAVLELIEKPPKWIHPIIMQSSQAMEGRAFQGLGYPDDGPVQTRWPQGNISGRVDVNEYANPLLQLQGKEIDKGLSGSAVVDRTTRRVIGMITAYQDIKRPSDAENVRFGYAIPIETIWKVYPELENELPPLTKRSPLVDGIHLLPYGYDFRIQNFLTEYLGTTEQPEPFGGREDAFKQLDEWLDGDTQRLLLAAPAGRGKSALLIRWLDRLTSRDDLALVFVPVSVRFRTNLSNTFFASLGARLAYIHGEDVPTSDTTSTDIWRSLASMYLTKPMTDERKLVVVLDGLDEAGDWEATADLIPSELPKNVRVVASARLLAGDSDAQSWLSRLGWERIGTASIFDLDPLDTSDIADVLLRMGVPLDKLGRRVDIVTELHHLSEGDPLLVNLYVEDLWSRGEKASRLLPEELHNIKPGYEGYFERWWNDQKKLWGREAPLHEKSVRLVFNLLCGAMGGLTKDDLVALDTENELNTYAIEDALTALKRFVIGVPDDHKEREIGYLLTHPKLRDYFWDKLTKTEQAELESRFISWGEHIIQALIAKELNPADIPHYLLQYYGAHLERTHESVEKFLPFVDCPYWHQAWLIYEGGYDGYLLDLERTLQKLESGLDASRQIRCDLIKCSIHSLNRNVAPELIAVLLRTKLWSPQRAIVQIQRIADEWMKARAIIEIFPLITDELKASMLDLVEHLESETERVEVLSQTVKYFPPELYSEIERMIRNVEDEKVRVSSLPRIAEFLPSYMKGTLLTILKDIKNEKILGKVLEQIVYYLPDNLKLESLEIVQTIENLNVRVKLLVEFARFLDGEQKFNTIHTALEAAKEINDENTRAELLLRLSSYISDESLVDLAEQILAQARTLEESELRTQVSIYVFMHTNSIPKAEIFQMINNLTNSVKKAELLRGLIKCYSENESDERDSILLHILKLSHEFKDRLYRIGFLGSLMDFAPGYLKDNVVKQALSAVMEISDEGNRANALHMLAHFSSKEMMPDLLAIARNIKHEDARATAFQHLAEYLSQDLMEDLLGDVKEFKNEIHRAEIFLWIAHRLPSQLTPQAIEIAKGIKNPKYRAWAYTCIIKYLPDDFQLELAREMITSKQDIEDEYEKSIAVSGLVKYMKDESKLILVADVRNIKDELARGCAINWIAQSLSGLARSEALNIARDINNEIWRFEAFVGFLSDASEDFQRSILNETLATAQQVDDPERRIQCLSELVAILPNDLKFVIIDEILVTVPHISDERRRAIILANLAIEIPASIGREVLSLSIGIEDEDDKAYVLRKITPNLTTELKSEAINALLKINDEVARCRSICNLVEYLPLPIVQEAIRKLPGFISKYYDESDHEVLESLCVHLPGEMIEDLFTTYAEIDQSRNQAQFLRVFAVRLPDHLRIQAIDLSHQITDSVDQIEALSGIARYLSEELKHEIMADILEQVNKLKLPISSSQLAIIIRNWQEIGFSFVKDWRTIWAKLIQIQGKQFRWELYRDIEAVAPLLAYLGGEKAITQTYRNIQEIDQWWP